jgi:hypothetical protein
MFTYQNILLSIIALGLSVLILLVSWVQTTGINKYQSILSAVATLPVASSDYYNLAVHYFTNLQPVRLRRGYTLPILSFFLLVMAYASVAYLGTQWSSYLETPNFIFGGAFILNSHTPVEIRAYQTGTVLISTMAFIGAYIYIISELIGRINNNDIEPITYYYFSTRIILATLTAAIIRHIIEFLEPAAQTTSYIIVLVGFIIGLRPDLWLNLVIAKASKRFGLLGEQTDPDAANMPSNFSLLLIEGLTEEKRTRLEELAIDNCQALADHNPFVIWARTAYQLLHIIDWMAQAQLCVLVGETGIHKLRMIAVRDIFALEAAWAGQSKDAVANTLAITSDIATDMLAYLQGNPSFRRLKQVYQQL